MSTQQMDFVLRLPSKIIFGPGKFNLLPEEVKSFTRSNKKIFLVMDPAVRQKILSQIENLFSEYRTFPYAIPAGEPTVEAVDKSADLARKENPALIIGIGGGSAMDTAKAVAGLVTNPGSSQNYRGQNLLRNPALPKIMVPTTAGTGSELTPTAVLIGQGKKGGINSPYLIPEVALLDPKLILDLPPEVTAATGLDALAHAIESFLSKNSSPFTEPLSLEAVRLLVEALPIAVDEGKNLEARTKTLMGSLIAGITLANAGVIAGHSLSYPLGGRYQVSHGVANGILLPYVIKELLDSATEKLSLLALALGIGKAKEVPDFLLSFERRLGFHKRMRDFGIPEGELENLVTEAQEIAVPLANTPKILTKEDLVRIYQSAY